MSVADTEASFNLRLSVTYSLAAATREITGSIWIVFDPKLKFVDTKVQVDVS